MSSLSDDMSVLEIADEVINEVYAQVDTWGEQNHPDASAFVYGIISAVAAQNVCDSRVDLGELTWSDIMIEELAEAVEDAVAGRETNLRAELVQVAAVAVNWIAAIDRREAVEVEPERPARSLWQTITDWWDGIELPDRLEPKV